MVFSAWVLLCVTSRCQLSLNSLDPVNYCPLSRANLGTEVLGHFMLGKHVRDSFHLKITSWNLLEMKIYLVTLFLVSESIY